MGLINRLRGAVTGFRNAYTDTITTEELIRLFNGGTMSDAGIEVSPDTAMRCSTVYACVRVLAETCAQLPLPLYRRNEAGRELDRNHPVSTILNVKPNRWQTSFEFREMMTAHAVLRGNAYAYIGRDLLGGVRELIPLRPGSIKPKQLDDLTVVYQYTKPDGSLSTFKQSDVLHVRGLTGNGIEGLTPITAYRNAVGLSLAAERHQGSSFGKGVKFPGIIKATKALKPEAIKNLRESFNDLHSGENAFKTPVLEEGMEWQSVGMTADDAQTIETRQFQRGEIASIFRVPLHMINGDTEASKGWSTLEQQASEFVTYSMVPWFERWEQAIARDLFNDKERDTLYVEHKVASLLRGDTQARYAAYNVAINSGWLNRNEVRELENLNPVDGLDEYLTPLNMTKAIDEQNKAQQSQQSNSKR